MAPDHLGYLWAAYRRGVFPQMGEGLTEAVFAEDMMKEAENGKLRVFIAPTGHGVIPVGVAIVGANALHGVLTYTTSVFWFPEAGPRNKLECLALLATEPLALGHLLVSTTGPEVAIFDRLAQYRLLRRVGRLKDFMGPDQDIVVYYGKHHRES